MNRPRGRRTAELAAALILSVAALAASRGFAQEAPALTAPEAPALGPLVPPDTVGDVVIQPIEHASLMLTWNGVDILFDPAQGPERLAGLPQPVVIFVTDIHPDHFHVDSLRAAAGNAAIIVAPQAVYDLMPLDLRALTTVLVNGAVAEFDGFSVEAVPMYNVDRIVPLHPKGRGNGYVLTLGDTRIYVAGDTDETPEMDALQGIDVAFLPIRPPFTMSAEQAVNAAATFHPGIVYPFHYGGDSLLPAEDVTRFAAMMAARDPSIEVRLRDWYPQRATAAR